MKKVAVLFVLALFVFGQTNSVFAHDRHRRGHHGWHHGRHGHHGHFYHHPRRHHIVRHYGGGYYPPPYWYGHIDGDVLVLGTAALGVSLAKGVAEVITSPFTVPFTEGTKRIAITEEHRTKREEIRANTVLNAPGVLEGDGNAEYVSSEGSARISANTPRPRPAVSYKEDEVKKCSKEQLKQGRVEWGTSGKFRNLTTGETCFYDLR